MDKELFVQNVKKRCAEKGVKPTVACRESGAGKNMLGRLELHGVVPSMEKVQMLAAYLGCTASDLLGDAPQSAAQPDSALRDEFARLFAQLTPEDQTEILAEMLRLRREQ